MSPWSLSRVQVGDQIVIRRQWVTNEDYYRRWPDGSWDHSIGHKGPWVRVPLDQVPKHVLDQITVADYRRD